VPSTSTCLVYGGRSMADEACVGDYDVGHGSTLHLVGRLRGGKGGFGALLRGQGRDGKMTTNFDACRDLQGRRIRHQRTEDELREWARESKERELENVAMQHIKNMAKQKRAEERNEVRDASASVPCNATRAMQRHATPCTAHATRPPHNRSPATHAQVDLTKVLEQQQKVSEGVQDAVKAALKQQQAAGKASGSGKRKPAGGAAASEEAKPKPAKKSRMLAALEDISDSDENSD
jgi:hypothetical protein